MHRIGLPNELEACTIAGEEGFAFHALEVFPTCATETSEIRSRSLIAAEKKLIPGRNLIAEQMNLPTAWIQLQQKKPNPVQKKPFPFSVVATQFIDAL